jgi:polyhydroxyalkanoate synthase subunit PhaC
MSMLDPSLDSEQLRTESRELQQRATELMAQLAAIREVDVGTAPKQAVHHIDKVTLYRYRAAVPPARQGPAVLLCYAMVNRPYMMDLQPDRSLIRRLVERGIDVFLIDWGYPDGADRFVDLNDYVNRYIDSCVAKVCALREEAQVNLLGICQGGTLSLCYTALHPERVRNLITMVTPVDFHTPDDLLSLWARDLDIQQLVASQGNVSGEFLNAAFTSLMPFRLLSQKYVGLLDIAQERDKLENFLRMEKWIFDSPDQPGAMFAQFVTHMYQHNRLIKGEVRIGDEPVQLKTIRQPVLNIYATQDHLVPPAASTCLGKLAGTTDYTELAVPGGHIGIYVSSKAQVGVPVTIADWLRQRADDRDA